MSVEASDVINRQQALAEGLSKSAITQKIKAGTWEPVLPPSLLGAIASQGPRVLRIMPKSREARPLLVIKNVSLDPTDTARPGTTTHPADHLPAHPPKATNQSQDANSTLLQLLRSAH